MEMGAVRQEVEEERPGMFLLNCALLRRRGMTLEEKMGALRVIKRAVLRSIFAVEVAVGDEINDEDGTVVDG